MRDQVILDIQEAYQQICEQQKVGVQLDEPTDEAAAKALKKLIPKGDKVLPLKSSPSSMVKAAEEYDIFDDIVEFCEGMQIFDSIDESEYFADLIIQEDLTQTFVDDVLEYFIQYDLLTEEDISYYLQEDLRGSALRSIINALSAAARRKAGLPIIKGGTKTVSPGVRVSTRPTPTVLGRTGEPLTKGVSSASSSIQTTVGSARRSRNASPEAWTHRNPGRLPIPNPPKTPPSTGKPDLYAGQLAQRRATSTTAASSTPTSPSPSTRGTGPSYVARRGVIDPLVTAMTLGMGHMAGLKPATNILKQMTSPIVQNVGKITQRSAPTAARTSRRVTGSATDPWSQFPKTTNKPRQYGLPKPPSPKTPSSKALTGSQPKGLLPAAKTSSKPTFKPEALPKPPRTVEPAGALVPTRGPKPTFKPEALPKPSTARTLTGSPQPKGLLPAAKTLSKQGQEIQIGSRTIPKLPPDVAPKPAWGPDAKLPKTPTAPGEVQRNILTQSGKTTTKGQSKPQNKASGPDPDSSPENQYRAIVQGNLNVRRAVRRRKARQEGENIRRGLAAAGAGIAAGAGTGAAMVKKEDDERRNREQNVKPVYNTMDPSGRIRSRLAVGPEYVGPKIVGPDTFERAFRRARRSGKKEFTYGNQKFTTQMAEEFFINYLLDEGFAHCEKTAYGIMDVMSEEWFQSIIEA